jgi:hypothetical protein
MFKDSMGLKDLTKVSSLWLSVLCETHPDP